MKYWKKLSHAQQDARITNALAQNIDYKQKVSLGVPASRLDGNVFYEQAPFLKDAPLLRTYVANPNHIGCHTLGESEDFFKGTQDIEREVIELLAVDVLKAEDQSCDGYVAGGGTEANIQAAWIYRNYFMQEHGAGQQEIALIGSEDTHYSIAKAANLLNLNWYSVPVANDTRAIIPAGLNGVVETAMANGIKYFIIISNMATTMFGSVDDPELYVAAMQQHNAQFRLHLDGAFGGFIYPTSTPESTVNFSNPHVSSVTLDAHKMLQAPYGTGVFLARKGLMQYVFTKEAQYVHGMDITLSGSRSGANAIAIWMILMTYGPHGWFEKINKLLYRTDWCCQQLDALGVSYYRYPRMNIITIRAGHVPHALAVKYGLVPDSHGQQVQWYKIVVMDHVEIEHLQAFIEELKAVNVTEA
ncbi:MAG: aspartate aminotransferase family protein [Chitinophagales bacterium]|nr:aspartate aminotransferase family protein [Chitinophagales bacterium]